MIGAAARCPHIVQQDTARDALAWAARRVAVASDAPTTSTEALRGALRHALAHRRTAPRRHAVNGLLSAIWAEVASLIATKHRRPPLTVRYAVGRAPLQLARPGLRARAATLAHPLRTARLESLDQARRWARPSARTESSEPTPRGEAVHLAG